MGVSHIAIIAAISLSGLIPSSCTKTFSARAKHSPGPNSAVANTNSLASSPGNNKDLGQLELINRHETCIDLGAGRSCLIFPNLLSRDSLQLTMSFQTKKADGKTQGLVVTQVTTRPGKPFEMAVGGMNITLTPEISQE